MSSPAEDMPTGQDYVYSEDHLGEFCAPHGGGIEEVTANDLAQYQEEHEQGAERHNPAHPIVKRVYQSKNGNQFAHPFSP
ncbi:hypothetical protein ACFLZG_00120 [Thermodesulfobacteriota bacterium]